jgi:hypothetical protein
MRHTVAHHHLRRPGVMSAPVSFLMSFLNQAPKAARVNAIPVAGDRNRRPLVVSMGSYTDHVQLEVGIVSIEQLLPSHTELLECRDPPLRCLARCACTPRAQGVHT